MLAQGLGIRLFAFGGGGGGGCSSLLGIVADTPTHQIRKFFLRGDFRYINFFVASDPSPPPPPGIVWTGH